MAICPFATPRLLPRSLTQPGIRPTQIISHTTDATPAAAETYFRRRDTRSSAHFGIGRDGRIVQWTDTAVRAVANHGANRRPDGTGAVSVETEGRPTEPWTDAQLDALVQLHVWLLRTHAGIGRRVCRSAADPGLGHHTLFGAPGPWTPAAKSCPGPRRAAQWRETVVPRVLAALDISHEQQEEDDMATSEEIAEAVLKELSAVEIPLPDGRTLPVREALSAAVAWAQRSQQRADRLEKRLDEIAGFLFAIDGTTRTSGAVAGAGQSSGSGSPSGSGPGSGSPSASGPGELLGKAVHVAEEAVETAVEHAVHREGVLEHVLDLFDRDRDKDREKKDKN